MGKPEGYPFLRISKQYGVDYGDVLQYADWMGQRRDKSLTYTKPAPEAYARVKAQAQDYAALSDAVMAAIAVQQAIRDGKIDWQTGEPCQYPEDLGDGRTGYLSPEEVRQRPHAPEDEPLVDW
jgi:hypothetical protein